MNMFKPVGADSVDSYIAQIEGERRAHIESLHDFIQKTTGFTPHFAYNMLGYGSFAYKNYKKEDIEWPLIALASQKNYISIYVCALDDGEYLAELYKDKLGKVSVGKSCIRFKKPDDVNLDVLAEVLRKAKDNPGLAGA